MPSSFIKKLGILVNLGALAVWLKVLRDYFAFNDRDVGFENQSFRPAVDTDGFTFPEVAGQNLKRQRVLQFALDGPFERTSAKGGIVTGFGQVLAGGFAHFELV